MRVQKSIIFEFILFHVFLAAYYFSFSNKDSWSGAIILLLMVVVLAALEYKRTKLFVSPLLFWYVFWLCVIVIGRMDLNLYPFYQTWSEKLLKIILLNTAVFFWCFWGGFFISSRIRNGRDPNVSINGELLISITIALMLFAILAFVINVMAVGVLPQLTGDANSYRQSFVETKYYRVVNFLRFSFALVPVAWCRSKDRTKKTLLLITTAIFLFEEMLSGWRSFTMQAMILFLTSLLVVLNHSTHHKQGNSFRIILCSVAGALIFIGYIAVTRDGVSGPFQEKIEYLIYTVYMYSAPNFLNFQTAMENVLPIGRFLYSAEAVSSFFVDFELLPSIDQSIGAFNVSTYLLDPWADLGIMGTAVWSAVIAAFSGVAAKINCKKENVFTVTVLGICNCVIFLMHNNFFLRATSVLVWIILSAGISIIVTRKKPN